MTTDVLSSVDPFWTEGFDDDGRLKSAGEEPAEAGKTVLELTGIHSAGHIAICLFFLIVCYFENSIVIYIYTRGKKLLATCLRVAFYYSSRSYHTITNGKGVYFSVA